MNILICIWLTLFGTISDITLKANTSVRPGVCILLDESNSMTKLKRSVLVLTNYIVRTFPKECEIRIFKFGNRKLNEQMLTGQNQSGDVITDKNYKPYGDSLIFDSMASVINKGIDGSALIVISDFSDNKSKMTETDVNKLAEEHGVKIVKLNLGDYDESNYGTRKY